MSSQKTTYFFHQHAHTMHKSKWLRFAAPALLFSLTVLWVRCGHPADAQATEKQKQPTSTFNTHIKSDMTHKIKALSEQHHPWVVGIRRHLHAHPELSGHEKETMTHISKILTELGIEHRTMVGGMYSVVAIIEGRNPKKRRVVLRADNDALPIQEANDVPYKSKNPGISHKCGHDGHTANLLGTARILHELRNEWEGTIVCIWEPHEEVLPGGAPSLIEAGVLDGASACIGLHVDPKLHIGTIGIKSGPYMASIDELHVTCIGKGAHGGSGVHESKDPILAQAYLLVALEQLKAHNCNSLTPMALSFGRVEGGNACNVIPDTVRLLGTLRTLDDEWRNRAHTRLIEIAEGVSKMTGVSIDFHIKKGHPVVVNDPDLTNLVKNAATEIIGAEQVINLQEWLASESFAHYGKVVPSVFIRLGVRNEVRGMTYGLHTALFDIEEEAFKTGTQVMTYAALNALAVSMTK